MAPLYSGLFVSFCILDALTYLASLTYTSHRSRILRAVRYLIAVAAESS